MLLFISKKQKKISIRNYQQYNRIENSGTRVSEGVTVLIKTEVPQSKLGLRTE